MIRTKLFLTFVVVIVLCAVDDAQAAENILITNAETSNVYISGINGINGETNFRPWFTGVETILNVADIITSLDLGYDVIITTAPYDLTGNPATPGDIIVDAAILKAADGDGADGSLLTFLADNDIFVNQSITSVLGGLDVELQSPGSIVIRADINANGGQLDFSVDTDEATTDGAEMLDIQATLTAAEINLDGGIVLGNDALIVSLAGVDAASWNISAANAGTVEAGTFSTANFTNFTILNGGDQSDTFTLAAGGSVSSINGGPGNDVIGGAAGGSTFVVNAADSGTVNGTPFVNAENLTGGAGVDVFTFSAGLTGTASGGAGDDTFAIIDGGSAGLIDGGTQADEVTYAGATGPVTVAIESFNNIENLTGSGNAGDTLQGTGTADVFTVSGANSGVAGSMNFSGFENLSGQSGNDTFTLAAGGSVSSINGGPGNDIIVGAAGGSTFVVNAADSGNVTGVSFFNVENLTGGANGDVFTITANLTGTAAGLGGDDTFAINDGGSAGLIDGGAQADEVTYAGATGPVTVAIDSFNNIEILTGSFNAGDTLQGTSLADNFTLTGVDSGVVNGVSFSAFENLSGLDGADIFNMDAGVSGTVDGGAGNDVIVGAAAANEFVVNAADSGTVNGTFFVNAENLTGGASGDIFTINAGLSGTASGAGGSDIFDVAANISATIDGGAGDDEAVVREPVANDLNIGNVENITYIPQPLPWVTFRVQGVVDSVDTALDSVFSLGDKYNLVYTFDSTSPDVDPTENSGVYNAMLSAYVTVGSYSASFTSFNPGQISVINFTNDDYRVNVFGVSGPAAAGLPLSDSQLLVLLFNASGAALTNTAMPVTPLDLNEFSAGSVGLSFDVSDFPFPMQASVRSSVDTFELVKSFRDVPLEYWASSFITRLAASGITAGCGNDNYCPTAPVTRAQMAVFLERGININDLPFVPPTATGNVFLDVAAGDFAASFIEQLFSDGITAGCGNNNYCPNALVSRAQMAVFLLRAKYGSSYSPPPATGIFSDVPLGSFAVAWIEQLAAEGITAGCGGGKYCPGKPVTRDQMAVFLVRTFGL